MQYNIYKQQQQIFNLNFNNRIDMDEDNAEYQQSGFKQKKQTSGFAQYSFIYELYKAIMVAGLKMPTPVQRKVIPVVMSGKDAIVCYKTGSGKTLSYLLPLINKLKCHSKIVGARALVLIPTRDLAEQISKVLKQYIKFTDLKYALLLGGHTYEGQFESLCANPDIIIATPGRLMQLLQQTDLKLGRIEMVVYDEADQLFENASFYDQLKEISQKCPVSQRLMFSATINETINEFAKIGLREYSYIHQEIALPEQMTIDAFIVRPEDKTSALFFVLEKITLNNKVIVFVSTKYHVDFLVSLVSNVYDCEGIYGKMDMDQRTTALDKFRRSQGRSILIVTDVAARGLDIPAVKFVVHYDYPTNHKTFVHRSGRTARKQEQGHTIALISNNELPYLIDLCQYVGRRLTLQSDTKETVNAGSIPIEIMDAYTQTIKKIIAKNDDIKDFQESANKAFQKFKTCRSEVNQNSVKKAKLLEIPIHFKFRSDGDKEEADFINRIRNFTPKKSFLELQRIMADVDPENDQFLTAVEKIRTQEKQKKDDREKKEKLRFKNSLNWKQMLNKDEVKQLQAYRDNKNKERIPITEVEGVQIQINERQKKSSKRDFRDPMHYISATKDPNKRTEFDDLPKIKSNELDLNIGDENPHQKKKERVWDKEKKNFIWKRDKEDKGANEEKGKKAYQKWKKTTKLFIPKVGQVEDDQQVNKAQENWDERRRFRHGWRENKSTERRGVNLKNNKTKAIEKKYKQRLINKSQREKTAPRGDRGGRPGKFKGGADRGGRSGRGGKAGRGGKGRR